MALVRNLHPSSTVLTNDSWFLYLLDRRHPTFGTYFKLGQTSTSAKELDADGNRFNSKRRNVHKLIERAPSVEDKGVFDVVHELRAYGPSDHVKAVVHFSRRQMQGVCRSLGFENLDDMFRTLLNSYGFLSNRGGHDREELINATSENLEQVLDLIVRLYCELTAAKTAGKPEFKLRFLQAELWTSGMARFVEHGRLLIQAAGGFGKSTISLRFACSDFVMSRPGVTLVLTPVKATGNDFKANAKFFQYNGREAVVVLLVDLTEKKFNELLVKTKADGNMLVVIATVQDARGKVKLKDEDGESAEDAEAVVKELLKLESKYSFLLGNIRLLIRDEIHLQYAAELTYTALSRLKPELTIDMTATLTAREAIMYSYNSDTIASCSLMRVLEAKKTGVPDLQSLPEMELIAASNMSASAEFLREFGVATEAELTSAKMFSVLEGKFCHKNGLSMLLERTFSLGKFGMLSGRKGMWGPALCGAEGQTDVYMLVIPRGDSSFAASQKCMLLCSLGNEKYGDQAFFVTAEELEHDAELNKRSLELSMEAIRCTNPGRKIIIVTHRKLLTGINIPQLEGIALWDSIESQSLFLQLWYRLFRAYPDKKVARMVVYEPGVGIADKSNSVARGLGALLADELDGLDSEAKKRRIAEFEDLISFSMYAEAKQQKLSTAELYAAYEMSFIAQMTEQFGGIVRSSAIASMLGDSYAEMLALIEGIAKGKALKPAKNNITDDNGGKTTKPGTKSTGEAAGEAADEEPVEKPELALETLQAMLQELPWVAHETQTFDLMSLLQHEMMAAFYGDQNTAALLHMVLASPAMFEFLTNRLVYTKVDMMRSVAIGLGTRAVVLDGQLILDLLNKMPARAKKVLLVNPKRLLLDAALKKYKDSKICVLTHEKDPYLWLFKKKGLTVITVEQKLLHGTMEDMKPKFDVVIGNPPYQSADDRRDGALWPEFLMLAVTHLSDDGVCAFITPDTWMADDSGKEHRAGATITVSGTRKTIFDRYHVECVRVGDSVNGLFPSVSVNFSYYILRAGSVGSTKLITDAGTSDVDLRKLPFIPRHCNNAILSILNKTLFSDHEKFQVVNGSYRFRVKDGEHTRSKSDKKFKYPFVTTSAKFTKGQYGFTAEPILGHGESKVVWSNSGYNAPFYDDGKFGLGDHSSAIFTSPEMGESLLWLLTESKLIKFLATLKSVGGYVIGISTIKNYLPKIDHPITNDDDLYAFFGLTEDEIYLIENDGSR